MYGLIGRYYPKPSSYKSLRFFSTLPPPSPPPPPPEPTQPPNKTRAFRMKDFMEITKFRLSMANTSIAAITYLMSSGVIDWRFGVFLGATQLMAMSSQTTNQRMEKEYDKLMIRTCNRPLPRSRISPEAAKILSMGLFLTSNSLFYFFLPFNSLLMANAIYFSYVLIYTPLKRTSPVNTFLGAISGSLPPYLGWLGGGGMFLDPMPLGICLYMFGWQFAHFYGILWIYKEDYKNAGFMMLDNEKKLIQHLKIMIGINLVSGVWVLGQLANPFGLYQIIISAALYHYAYKPVKKFELEDSKARAREMKKMSYIYLMVFFGILVGDCAYKAFKGEKTKDKKVKEI